MIALGGSQVVGASVNSVSEYVGWVAEVVFVMLELMGGGGVGQGADVSVSVRVSVLVIVIGSMLVLHRGVLHGVVVSLMCLGSSSKQLSRRWVVSFNMF